jgi:hypothetical protein
MTDMTPGEVVKIDLKEGYQNTSYSLAKEMKYFFAPMEGGIAM